MRIVLLGPPGAGKGSVGRPLSEYLKIPVISTGDIFRDNIQKNTDLGKSVKEYMDKGHLIPDDITISIVNNRLDEKDCENGFILDGYPRTLKQAKALTAKLSENNLSLDLALNVLLSDEMIIHRLSQRVVCSGCGEVYNLMKKTPSVEGVCDKCGGKIAVRDDDAPQTVKIRLENYHRQNEEIEKYYLENGLLKTMDNNCSIREGFEKALDLVNSVS